MTIAHPRYESLTPAALLDGGTITNDDICYLSDRAGEAGDMDQVAICERALDGSATDRAECARVLRIMRTDDEAPGWVAQYQAARDKGTPDLVSDADGDIDDALYLWRLGYAHQAVLDVENDGTDDVLVLCRHGERRIVAYLDQATQPPCWCAYYVSGGHPAHLTPWRPDP